MEKELLNKIISEEENLFDFGATEEKPVEEIKNSTPAASSSEKSKISYEEFLEKELLKKEIQDLKAKTEDSTYPMFYPNFETIMKFKHEYKNITMIEIGDKIEETYWDIPSQMYLIKPLSYIAYMNFLEEVGSISSNLGAYYRMMMKECILFPEIDENDIDEMPSGVADILINQLNKMTRFDTVKSVQRI